jgi:hypothetical protein
MLPGAGAYPQAPVLSPCPRWSLKEEAGIDLVFSAGVPGLWQIVTLSLPPDGTGVAVGSSGRGVAVGSRGIGVRVA